jgi:hypothetical protein
MSGRSVIRAMAALAMGLATGACAAEAAVTAPAAEPTATFNPTADAYVDEDSPRTNYGESGQLAVDASPTKVSYLTFSVKDLSQQVTSAKLRLKVGNGIFTSSVSGGTVSTISDISWSETDIRYNNRPAVDGATLGTLGAVKSNTWYEVDVTSAIRGNGTYGFALTNTSRDGARYDSREAGSDAPQLVINSDPSAAPPTEAVLVGAGDIATCSNSNDEATARLLDEIPGTVFTTGDAAYPDGSLTDFLRCYAPTWGRHLACTRPVPGNHEYRTPDAAAYFDYFGAAAGVIGRGYYSYDIGNWHVVGINSNCSKIGGCDVGSPQERWLRADLAASTKPCTVAFWHHPLFTSGDNHSPSTEMRPIFDALYDNNAELVVTGHNHEYERFAPQNPSGQRDTTRGIRAFVVGTGGAGLYGFGSPEPNSEVRNSDTHGVLKLSLKSNGYDWEFIPAGGGTFTDSGSGSCH